MLRVAQAAMLPLFVGACSPSELRREAPDLILISVDTLRVDRLGAWGGSVSTPTIDGLVARGTRFDQATTSLPRTTPALGSLHTGLPPHGHGAREVGDLVRHGTNMAEVFGSQGYATHGLSANSASGSAQGFARGMDSFDDAYGVPAEELTARALEVVAGVRDREQPLFLWVHYLDPHFPYTAPGTDLSGPCASRAAALKAREVSAATVFADLDGGSSAALEDCKARYDDEVAYVDSQLQVLLAGLEREGRLERAVLVFTADHGENLGEDGLFYEHGPSLAEAAVRVPLVFVGSERLEGRPGAGLTRHDLVQLEDVAPTLYELASVPPEVRPELDGRDLSGLFTSEQPPAAGQRAFHESGSALQPGLLGWLHAGESRGRHCVHGERFSLCEGGEEPRALYDHVVDPGLSAPVLDLEQDARLTAAMARWPAERTRRRAVRDGTHKLEARPQLEGDYALTLSTLSTPGVPMDDPAVQGRLSEALTAWASGLADDDQTERSEQQRQALRELGYVE